MSLYNKYKKLYNLSLEQKKSIEDSDFDLLLNVLEQKQEIIDEIEKSDLQEYLLNQEEPEEALAQLKKLLHKLAGLEEKNRKNLSKKKDKLGTEIKSFNLKQRGKKGYQTANNYEAKFIDKKS